MTPADTDMSEPERRTRRRRRRPAPTVAADLAERGPSRRGLERYRGGSAALPLTTASEHSPVGSRLPGAARVACALSTTPYRPREGRRGDCLDESAAAGSAGRDHGIRKIYRAVEGLRPVGAESGAAQRSSAADAGASAEGAARRQGRAQRQPDPRGGRRPAGRAEGGRGRARTSCRGSRAPAPARSICRRRSRASSTRPRRSRRRPATASSRSSGCCWRWRWLRETPAGKALGAAGVTPQKLNARDRRSAQGPQGRQRLGRGGL